MLAELSNTCLFLWDLSSDDCASWVQAWGSIFAIVAAVLAVNHSHNLQVRQRRKDAFEAQTAFLEVIFQLLGAAHQVAEKIYQLELKGGVTPGEYAAMKTELTTLDDAMERIPIDRLDRYEFVEAWLVGQTQVRTLFKGVEYITSPLVSKQLEQHFVRNLANGARQVLEQRAKRLFEAIGARKGTDVK